MVQNRGIVKTYGKSIKLLLGTLLYLKRLCVFYIILIVLNKNIILTHIYSLLFVDFSFD